MYEITWGYLTGKTLTYGAYQPNGTVRTAAGTSFPEVAGTGYYAASDASIQAGDFVVIREGVVEVGQGQFKTEVSASGIETKIDTIDTNVDTINTNVNTIDTKIGTLTIKQSGTYNITDETVPPPSLQITIA